MEQRVDNEWALFDPLAMVTLLDRYTGCRFNGAVAARFNFERKYLMKDFAEKVHIPRKLTLKRHHQKIAPLKAA